MQDLVFELFTSRHQCMLPQALPCLYVCLLKRECECVGGCRALTACVLWEITMQDLQPIVDWQEDVAEMLVG